MIRDELTKDEARRLQRARAVLASGETGHDIGDLAARIGRLEWWLGDIVKLVESLTGQDRSAAP